MMNLKLFQQHPALLTQLNEVQPLFQQIIDTAAPVFTGLAIDHIALRVNQFTLAQQWQASLAEDATLLSDSWINGRPIYLYELTSPLIVLGQAVRVVELPFPTEKIYPQQGWEHIEMVAPFSANEGIEQWFERIENQLNTKNGKLIWKKSCHKADGDGLPNPTVAIKLADSSNYTTIKLHPYAIKQVVISE